MKSKREKPLKPPAKAAPHGPMISPAPGGGKCHETSRSTTGADETRRR